MEFLGTLSPTWNRSTTFLFIWISYFISQPEKCQLSTEISFDRSSHPWAWKRESASHQRLVVIIGSIPLEQSFWFMEPEKCVKWNCKELLIFKLISCVNWRGIHRKTAHNQFKQLIYNRNCNCFVDLFVEDLNLYLVWMKSLRERNQVTRML